MSRPNHRYVTKAALEGGSTRYHGSKNKQGNQSNSEKIAAFNKNFSSFYYFLCSLSFKPLLAQRTLTIDA